MGVRPTLITMYHTAPGDGLMRVSQEFVDYNPGFLGTRSACANYASAQAQSEHRTARIGSLRHGSHHPDAPHSEHVKSRFPEMLVRRQHIRNLEFPHDYKTRAISERVPMI